MIALSNDNGCLSMIQPEGLAPLRSRSIFWSWIDQYLPCYWSLAINQQYTKCMCNISSTCYGSHTAKSAVIISSLISDYLKMICLFFVCRLMVSPLMLCLRHPHYLSLSLLCSNAHQSVLTLLSKLCLALRTSQTLQFNSSIVINFLYSSTL